MTPAELNQSISLMSGCTNMRLSSQYTPSTTSILAYMLATWRAHVTGVKWLHIIQHQKWGKAVGQKVLVQAPGIWRGRVFLGGEGGGGAPVLRLIADKVLLPCAAIAH